MFSPVVYYCIFPDVLLLSLSCPYGCFRTLIMNNLTIAVIFMLFPATTCPHKHHIQRIPSAWAASCWSGASEGLHDEASGAGRRHEGVLGLLFASGIVRHSVHVCQVESSCNVMAHGYAREGKWWGNWRMEWVASTLTLPRNMVYPALLPLMHTPRLPVVDWTDAPTDLNGLVRFAERRNLVSACVPSHFKHSLAHLFLPQTPTPQALMTCVGRYLSLSWHEVCSQSILIKRSWRWRQEFYTKWWYTSSLDGLTTRITRRGVVWRGLEL